MELRHNSFVVVPIDKATVNIAVICKQFYGSVITADTYSEINNTSKNEIINNNIEDLKSKFGIDNIARTVLVRQICIGCQKCIKHLTRLDLLLPPVSCHLCP